MKVQIKSKQDYGTHVEEINENIECEIIREKDFIELENKDIHIVIYNKKIIQNRNGNRIIIEEEKENETDYATAYGTLKLKTKGLSIENKENVIIVRYEIDFGGQKYINELEIKM